MIIETPINDASVWRANDLGGRESWIRHLTPAMIDEVRAAIPRVGRTPPHLIMAADFPLPGLAGLLGSVHDDLENGRGFVVLAGWPVDDFSHDDTMAAYYMLAAQVGDIVVPNYEGQSVVDVIDENIPYSHLSRGYRSNKRLPFHSDGAGLTALLCLDVAARGGVSLLVSAITLFNTILAERPDDLALLARGFYHHRRRQHDPGEHPLSAKPIPVFAFHDGYLHCCYNRNPIDWVEKEGMLLSGEEVAVLDHVDALVARTELQAVLEMEKGDMQFVNNFTILHSRTEYHDDADHRRHLVRLWMDDPRSKRLGESLLDLYVPGTSRFQAAHS